ncbi:MAG: FAD-dependent oxidoreductase [Cyclobacteriaceae bacterium]|jgi:ribulose 1,5-bisphosphate synthetase/thiazole synthase
MKRRNFLNRLSLSAGAVLLSSGCRQSIDKKEIPDNAELDEKTNSGSVVEPSREIPVVDKTDVLVVGGGPGGVAAAIAASRTGAKTILVERYNHLGGLWTGGLVLPLLSTHGLNKKNDQIKAIYGIGDEIAERLKNLGMAINEVNPVVDPEAAKYVLEMMVKEAGITMYYHCWAANVITSDDTINAVILETKSGRVAIEPKVVIDCTGDGDIFHLAGEDYDVMQFEIGLVHRLGNVDRVDRSRPGYKKINIGGETPIPSVNWVNMTGGDYEDALDFKRLSELQQEHRIEIWDNVQKIRSSPGYEDIFLLDTAPQQGVRMSRILKGEYQLTLDDSMTYKNFEDVIGVSGGWISLLYEGQRIEWEERPIWQIPYRALVPRKTQNLLVAGRCFSFEQELFQDARIIGTCLITGHGAGVAAALAAKTGNSTKQIDIKEIQHILKTQNVYFG